MNLNLRRRIQRGAGVTMAQSAMGASISAAPSRTPSHPWKTRLGWNARAKQWVATIEPGFVNEATPIYRATFAEQKSLDPEWGINPLSGKPYFSADVFTRHTATAGTRTVDVPLYLAPTIPLALRALGFDGDPSLPVPDYFQRLGVAPAPALPSLDDALAGTPLPNAAAPRGLRLLRACDFILHQPRSALTSTITLEPGPATGVSNVKQVLSTRPATPGDVLRVFTGVAIDRTPQTIDPLAGDYTEQTFDEVLISTAYLLSPANAALGSDPDLTWQPFVRHRLFWNLNYAQPGFRPLPGDPGVPFIPPLAGGAAQLVINFLTAAINDATTQALNILLAHSMAGCFYTATGGGIDAPVAPEVAAKIGGLNKEEIAQQRAAAALQELRAQRLDPEFPYVAEPFATSLLSAA